MDSKKPNLETAVYCLIFLIALLVRMIGLGQTPLNDFEAVPALQAFAVSQAQETAIGGQPGYVLLTAALFRMMTASDFWARFWPALVGAAIVLVPYLLRSRFPGKTGLIAALFLAIDPALVAISRTAGGASLALVFGLLAAAFMIRKEWIAGGIFLGFAMASGAFFWTGLVLGGIIFVVIRLQSNVKLPLPSSGKDWALLGITTSIAAVMGSSGFFFQPSGLSGIGNGLVSFAERWSTASLVSLKTEGIVFGFTYFPALILGAAGLIVSKKQHPFLTRVLLTWVIAATLLVVLLPSREINDWVWAALPLWGLASLGIDAFLQKIVESERLVLAAQFTVTVALLIFSGLNLEAYFFNSYGDLTIDRNRLIGAGLPIILLIIVTAFLAWGWSPQTALRGLGLGISVLLVVWDFSAGIKSAGGLVQASSIAWKPQPIVVDERLLASQVEELSLWNHGQRQAIDIQVVNYDQPALRWALRNFQNTTWDLSYSQVETPSIIIAPDYQQIGSTTLYRGQGISWAQYPSFDQMNFPQWMRWAFYRQSPVDEIRLILYARNDLFK
jgi:hypothetical protein